MRYDPKDEQFVKAVKEGIRRELDERNEARSKQGLEMIGGALLAGVVMWSIMSYKSCPIEKNNQAADIQSTGHPEQLTGLNSVIEHCSKYHQGFDQEAGKNGRRDHGLVRCLDGTSFQFNRYQGREAVYQRVGRR